jgi:hypothetical protein
MADLSGILTYSTSGLVIELLGHKDWKIKRKAFTVILNTPFSPSTPPVVTKNIAM